MTHEIQKRFDAAETLLEKVKILLDDAHEPEVVYDKKTFDQTETIDDVALIQCFYGTNISRIRATTQALEFNLQMTSRPSSWIFVECQKKRSDCAFQWVEQYGVKYIFVKMKPENEGIMLKHPLWNIGVGNCKEPKLCFVDSDVVLCESDWVKKACVAFETYDVISLASHQYYQADDKCQLHESIGYKWVKTGKVDSGHAGFTVGMTRAAFNLIGGLDPAIILDDIHLYHKIIGDADFGFFKKWTKPFELPLCKRLGYNLELGYVDIVACHVWHGEARSKYEDLTRLLVASGVKSMSDMFDHSKSDAALPTWKLNDLRVRALRKTILEYGKYVKEHELDENEHRFDIVGQYKAEMKKIAGEPDKDHPLFICTIAKDRFGFKMETITEFKNLVEARFAFTNPQPKIMVFTDCKKCDFKATSEGFTVVPLKNYNPNDELAQYRRKDVKFPKNAVIFHIPIQVEDFDTELWIPPEPTYGSNGTLLFMANTKWN